MGFPFRGPAPATDDQVGILGSILDWAGRLNGALNPVSPLLAASKTLPGIIQLGTAAEAAAGVDDGHAVTAASLAALLASAPVKQVYRPATLVALNALAATAQQGSLAVLMGLPIGTNSTYINTSIWMFYAGTWYLATQMYVGTVANADIPTQVAAIAEVNAAILAQPKLAIPGGSSAMVGARFVYNSTKWVLSSGTAPLGFINGYTSWDAGNAATQWQTSFTREGRHVTARFAVRQDPVAAFPTIPSNIGVIPVGFRPAQNTMVAGMTYNGGFNGVGTIECAGDGTGAVLCSYLSNGYAGTRGLFGSTTWEAAD